MQHSEFISSIEAAMAGSLDPARLAAWRQHQAACPACRRLLASWPAAAPVPDLTGAVLDAIRPAAEPRWLRPVWLAPALASLALVLLLAAFWNPEKAWLKADRSLAALELSSQNQKGGS